MDNLSEVTKAGCWKTMLIKRCYVLIKGCQFYWASWTQLKLWHGCWAGWGGVVLQSHLVWEHHLACLHVLEDLVGSVQGAHLGALCPDKGGQVNEPEAVAVAQQALGPHVGHRGVLLRALLGQLDLLRNRIREKKQHVTTQQDKTLGAHPGASVQCLGLVGQTMSVWNHSAYDMTWHKSFQFCIFEISIVTPKRWEKEREVDTGGD